MRNTSRLIGSLILAVAFLGPVAMAAARANQGVGVQIRIYDRKHKDYHDWDDRENHEWGIYLTDNHRKFHEYSRASRREQDHYWNWRHRHHDRD